jgi:hypothetical protein
MASSDYTKNAQYARLEYQINPKARLIYTLSYAKYNSQTSGSVDSVAFYNRQYVSTTDFTYRKAYSLRTRLTFEKDWAKGSQTYVTVLREIMNMVKIQATVFVGLQELLPQEAKSTQTILEA